jgi:hypothetical protein
VATERPDPRPRRLTDGDGSDSRADPPPVDAVLRSTGDASVHLIRLAAFYAAKPFAYLI